MNYDMNIYNELYIIIQWKYKTKSQKVKSEKNYIKLFSLGTSPN